MSDKAVTDKEIRRTPGIRSGGKAELVHMRREGLATQEKNNWLHRGAARPYWPKDKQNTPAQTGASPTPEVSVECGAKAYKLPSWGTKARGAWVSLKGQCWQEARGGGGGY